MHGMPPASAFDCESVNGFKCFLDDCDLSKLLLKCVLRDVVSTVVSLLTFHSF